MTDTGLLDELACTRLMVRASAFADRHDVEGFVSLFSPAGVVDRIGQPFVGQDAIRAFMEGRPRERITRHLLLPPVIELDGEDAASGVSYFLLYDGTDTTGEGEVLPLRTPLLVGEYHQTYERLNGEWKVTMHRVVPVFRPGIGEMR